MLSPQMSRLTLCNQDILLPLNKRGVLHKLCKQQPPYMWRTNPLLTYNAIALKSPYGGLEISRLGDQTAVPTLSQTFTY